jgi:hypothetical protein
LVVPVALATIEEMRVPGNASVEGHVSRDADPEAAGGAVGDRRRGGDHPFLVVVGPGRWRGRLVAQAQVAEDVEEVLRRLARTGWSVLSLPFGAVSSGV